MRYFVLRRDEALMPGEAWITAEHPDVIDPDELIERVGDRFVTEDELTSGEVHPASVRALEAWRRGDDTVPERFKAREELRTFAHCRIEECEKIVDDGAFAAAADILRVVVDRLEREP